MNVYSFKSHSISTVFVKVFDRDNVYSYSITERDVRQQQLLAQLKQQQLKMTPTHFIGAGEGRVGEHKDLSLLVLV